MSDKEDKALVTDKYHPTLLAPAYKAAQRGLTETEIADFIGISRSTLNRWRVKYPEFGEAIRMGKEEPDNRVIGQLYQSALGFHITIKKGAMNKAGELVEWEETQYIKPEITAQIFYLKNRKNNEWNDRTGQQNNDGSFENYSDAELARLVREKASKLVAVKAVDKVLEGVVVTERPEKDITPKPPAEDEVLDGGPRLDPKKKT